MTALEMIAEWRKGCSCGSKEHPEECHDCTRTLIDCVEAALKRAASLSDAGSGYPKSREPIKFAGPLPK